MQLLKKYLTGPAMRRVTAAPNEGEAFNGFSEVRFGNSGVLADSEPIEQEKALKFNSVLTNAIILRNTLDIADVVRQLQADGEVVAPEDLARISPYRTEHSMRFGEYSTRELDLAHDAYQSRLDVDFTTLDPDGPEEAA